MTARPCRECGTTEGVRPYLSGPRCPAHTPAAMAGRPEPDAAAYCPPRICLCHDPDCPAAKTPAAAAPTTTAIDIAHVKSGKRAAGRGYDRTNKKGVSA